MILCQVKENSKNRSGANRSMDNKSGRESRHREDGGAPNKMWVNIKGYLRPFVGGVETIVGRKTREAASAHGGVLNGDHHGAGVEAAKAVHEGKKHIPAPKAVVLYD